MCGIHHKYNEKMSSSLLISPVLEITANRTKDATSSIIAAHVISRPILVDSRSKLCINLAAMPIAVEDKLTPAISPSRLEKAWKRGSMATAHSTGRVVPEKAMQAALRPILRMVLSSIWRPPSNTISSSPNRPISFTLPQTQRKTPAQHKQPKEQHKIGEEYTPLKKISCTLLAS